MSRLLELQMEFSVKMADFISRLNLAGYQITMGECYRTKEQAELNAKKGIGIANSLHCDRLAVDLNLFKEGKLLTADGYLPAGLIWEKMGGTWGGRFNDGHHYSLEHEGKK